MALIASFFQDLVYTDGNKPAIKVMVNTSSIKEIRILFSKGQEMKEHKAPYAITVQVLKGEIEFMAEGGTYVLAEGMLIALEANVPHSLLGISDSIVRLSLNMNDQAARVQSV